jgi:hypothetical protein
MTVDSDGDLGTTHAADTQHRVIFQELAVRPLPRLGVTGSERCNHGGEMNLRPAR